MQTFQVCDLAIVSERDAAKVLAWLYGQVNLYMGSEPYVVGAVLEYTSIIEQGIIFVP